MLTNILQGLEVDTEGLLPILTHGRRQISKKAIQWLLTLLGGLEPWSVPPFDQSPLHSRDLLMVSHRLHHGDLETGLHPLTPLDLVVTVLKSTQSHLASVKNAGKRSLRLAE